MIEGLDTPGFISKKLIYQDWSRCERLILMVVIIYRAAGALCWV